MNTTTLLASGNTHNSPSYGPAPIILERGEGVWIFDSEGRRYLDFLAGIAVNSLGHNHPTLVAALHAQIGKVLHVSNMFFNEPQIRLMEELCRVSFADRVFLCNSGAEANEAALKLARRFQKVVRKEADRTHFVSMTNSFHGRTYGAITATGQPKYHKGFEPMLPGFSYVDFNDLESLKSAVNSQTAAVIVECVQGEGGVRPASVEYLKAVRELCDASGALLIFDEVQTGVGRLGTMFGYQSYGVVPDIMTLAKGLGGGVPIGACLANEEVFSGFEKGSHATTFGGNPLVCAAALAVLETISKEGLCENAAERGNQLWAGLRRVCEGNSAIVEIRGRGLMVGVECAGTAATDLVNLCREEGMLVNLAGPSTVRFVPPLIVTSDDVELAVSIFGRALSRLSFAAG